MPSPIPFLLDENVDVAVAAYLEERGHRVRPVPAILGAGTADEVIAALGNADNAIVVTHDKDFKLLAQRAPEGSRQRFRKLGRISLRCTPARARRRIEQVIESVEFEFALAQRRTDTRLIMAISDTIFTVER